MDGADHRNYSHHQILLGHYTGAREGFNGMVIKSLRGKGKTIEINRLNKITALFMLVTTWAVATLNPSILGMIETTGRPDYRDDPVPDADVRDSESACDA